MLQRQPSSDLTVYITSPSPAFTRTYQSHNHNQHACSTSFTIASLPRPTSIQTSTSSAKVEPPPASQDTLQTYSNLLRYISNFCNLVQYQFSATVLFWHPRQQHQSPSTLLHKHMCIDTSSNKCIAAPNNPIGDISLEADCIFQSLRKLPA